MDIKVNSTWWSGEVLNECPTAKDFASKYIGERLEDELIFIYESLQAANGITAEKTEPPVIVNKGEGESEHDGEGA